MRRFPAQILPISAQGVFVKILVTPRSFGKTNPELFDRLAQAGLEVIRNDTGGILSAEQMKEKLADCAGVILGVDPMDAPVLAAAPPSRPLPNTALGWTTSTLRPARSAASRSRAP